jgi:hypothetical protein
MWISQVKTKILPSAKYDSHCAHAGQYFVKNCIEFYENMADSLVTDVRC